MLTYPNLPIHAAGDEHITIEDGHRVLAEAAASNDFRSLPAVGQTKGFTADPNEHVRQAKIYLATRFDDLRAIARWSALMAEPTSL